MVNRALNFFLFYMLRSLKCNPLNLLINIYIFVDYFERFVLDKKADKSFEFKVLKSEKCTIKQMTKTSNNLDCVAFRQ